MARTRLVLAAIAALAPGPASAHVQDYQIVRLINYRTTCRLESLAPRPAPTGTLRYRATCENETFYPDGVDIVCADAEDERSCKVLTQERSLDNLHMLDGRH